MKRQNGSSTVHIDYLSDDGPQNDGVPRVKETRLRKKEKQKGTIMLSIQIGGTYDGTKRRKKNKRWAQNSTDDTGGFKSRNHVHSDWMLM